MRKKNKEDISFQYKIVQTLVLLQANDKFSGDLKYLRETYKVPKKGVTEKDISDWIDKQGANFWEEIFTILDKYALSNIYLFPLIILISTRKRPRKEYLEELKIEPIRCDRKETEKNSKYFFIEIFPETTLKDIQQYWKKIQKERKDFFGYKIGKIEKRPNILRDTGLVEFKRQGAKNKQLADAFNKFGPKQEKSLLYNDIAIIIKRMKDAAKKRVKK